MFKYKPWFLLALLSLFFTGCQHPLRNLAQEKVAFDEVYGTTQGQRVRLVYEGIIEHYDSLTEVEKSELAKVTLKDFDGDNALLPLPRVLSELEFDELSRGVEQRGKALRAFLEDHYSGKKAYLKQGIIPKAVLDRVIKRAGEEDWEKFIKPDNLNFWYGPDVIRGPPSDEFPNGQFLVVEDNPSFIGGMGDLIRAREILDKYMPAYSKVTKSEGAENFYERLLSDYKRRAKRFKGKAVLVQYITALTADNEEKRIRALMEEAGIDVVFVNPYTKNSGWKENKKRLRVDGDDLFIETRSETGIISTEKVGYIITNMNPQDLELSHAGNEKYHIMAEAEWELEQKGLKKGYREGLRNLMKANPQTGDIPYNEIKTFIKENSPYKTSFDQQLGIPGLTDLTAKGKLGITNGPGMEFVGDKEFYIYIEGFIRYYLGEEPILRNMDTGSFARINHEGREVIDRRALNKVFKKKNNYVIKDVIGRGGDAVWVGPKVADDIWEEVKLKVSENPARYIYQEFNPLSTMSGFIGDIRLISDVSKSGVKVANIPWARVVKMDGDGLVNISANGFEATVLVRKLSTLGTCNKLFRNILLQ